MVSRCNTARLGLTWLYLFGWLGPALAVSAQQTPIQFLPLQVGNTWFYNADPAGVPRDTMVVTGTVEIGTHSYFTVKWPFDPNPGDSLVDTLRLGGESAEIIRYELGSESALFDFRQPDSFWYQVPKLFPGVAYPRPYQVRVRRDRPCETVVGRFSCFELWFDPGERGGDQLLHFAPELGLVSWRSGIWGALRLTRAIVAGVTHTSIGREAADPPSLPLVDENSCALDIFPSPFSDEVSLSFEQRRPTTLDVFDMTGRRVTEQVVPAGNGTTKLNTSSGVKGVYLFLKTNAIESCTGTDIRL